MLQTFEMRWFFRDIPLEPSQHFGSAVEMQQRTDWYALPCNPRCGIKLREGRLEAKMQAASHGSRVFRSFSGRLEEWKKWSLEFPLGEAPREDELAAGGWLAVGKRRALLRFAVDGHQVVDCPTRPTNGCEFELTELTVQRQVWWTVGFEAVGQREQLESNLRRVAELITDRGGLRLPFQTPDSYGYAHWLAQFA